MKEIFLTAKEGDTLQSFSTKLHERDSIRIAGDVEYAKGWFNVDSV